MHGDPTMFDKVPLIGQFLSKTAKSHHEHHKQVLMNMHYIERHSVNGFSWKQSFILGVIFWIFFKILKIRNIMRYVQKLTDEY